MNKLDAILKSLGACRKVGEWTVMLCEYLVSSLLYTVVLSRGVTC